MVRKVIIHWLDRCPSARDEWKAVPNRKTADTRTPPWLKICTNIIIITYKRKQIPAYLQPSRPSITKNNIRKSIFHIALSVKRSNYSSSHAKSEQTKRPFINFPTDPCSESRSDIRQTVTIRDKTVWSALPAHQNGWWATGPTPLAFVLPF